MRSALAPYLLQQRDTLQRRVQRQEVENQQLADAVRAGRRHVEALQLQSRAQWQVWQVGAPARGRLPRAPPCPGQSACPSAALLARPHVPRPVPQAHAAERLLEPSHTPDALRATRVSFPGG